MSNMVHDLMPDPDRRDGALIRVQQAINSAHELETLTPTQIKVLYTLSMGPTVKEAGILLNMSRHTVYSHLKSSSRILGAKNRTHAVAIALRKGFIN